MKLTDYHSLCLLKPNQLADQKNLPLSLNRDTHHHDNHILPTTVATSHKPPTTTTTSSTEMKKLTFENEARRRRLKRSSIGILLNLLSVQEKHTVQEERP